MSQKRIGILTSGGDCAGLNAALRAVVHRAVLGFGWEVVGIEQGTLGLMERPIRARALTVEEFDGTLLRRGGTILGSTNRGDPFAFPMPDGSKTDRSQSVVEGYRALGLDALIGIGGDGSQALLRRLAQQGGLNLVCIPKTIDNDVGVTEVSIGYDTAVEAVTYALDCLQPTAASHNRVMILEVMGRDAGHIALIGGIAGGADVILIPEIPYRIENVARKIDAVRNQQGRNFALVVVAEAVRTAEGERVTVGDPGVTRYGGVGHYIGEILGQRIDAEIRVTVLGHIQRGGIPDARDRVMASAFGVHAVDLIAAGRFDRMVGWRDRKVIDVPLEDVIDQPRVVELDGAIVHTARALGICLGDA
ncbi:MAG: ATP-dependent 6-phosphofructokinase [Alphaproteobacteria bacterium]|nr:ATP-dependent 6-phosphofructokinase [Alphaproteobacteria bacterium]